MLSDVLGQEPLGALLLSEAFPRSSPRLTKLEVVNAIGRVMNRKAILREGKVLGSAAATRTFSRAKIKKKGFSVA